MTNPIPTQSDWREEVKGYYHSQEFDANHDEEEIKMWTDFIQSVADKSWNEGYREKMRDVETELPEMIKEAVDTFRTRAIEELDNLKTKWLTDEEILTEGNKHQLVRSSLEEAKTKINKLTI